MALVDWEKSGELQDVSRQKRLCGREKNPSNVSPTVQKEHVLFVLLSLTEPFGFMEILFFPPLNLLVGFYFVFPFKLGRCSLSWLVENGLLAENKAWKQQLTRLSAGFQINTNLWPPCFGSSRPKDNKMKHYPSLILL